MLIFGNQAYYNDKDEWPAKVVALEPNREARLKALREGPYGRCYKPFIVIATWLRGVMCMDLIDLNQPNYTLGVLR
jgi:hypothetical protein